MLKLLIADCSENFQAILAGAVQTAFYVECCSTGGQLRSLLHSFKPDILVLDLMLPELDGLELLQEIREEALCRSCIVTSAFVSSYLLEALQELPVDYFYRKPCSPTAVAHRIEDLAERLSPSPTMPDPQGAISGTLLALGMPVHKKGFRYARRGILMLAQDPDSQITKEVYPTIAKEYRSTPFAVEKALRSAIDYAWEDHDPDIWGRYFPPVLDGQIPRPTNTKFLSRLADVMAGYLQKQA